MSRVGHQIPAASTHNWEFVERVLVHPNTSDALKDHTELATWMGKPYPLNLRPLTRE